jgi:predicted nuclease of restriction endonuclease-like RecB superfamily
MSGFGGSTEWERGETLELFSAGLGFEPGQVEELLWLDAEENDRLVLRRRKDGESFRPPTPGEVARQYNRLAIETLLYNSSEIIFGLGQTLPAALIKRIGFFSKEFRIPYDLEYNALAEVQLRLYGPAEAFGPPTKHGERLARMAFIILALANKISDPEIQAIENEEDFAGPHTTILDEKPAKTGKKVTIKPGVSASPLRSAIAVVHLRDKVYNFDLLSFAHTIRRVDEESTDAAANSASPDANAAVPEIRETKASYKAVPQLPAATPDAEFDSSVEARFYHEFAALEREGQTAGWRLEREPEALALPEENLLFIPDFALLRGKRRVWLEIIGFWTPAYRARKLEKLGKLKKKGGLDLLLAAAEELKADFKEAPFPIIFYKNALKPLDLLALLNRQYAEFEERLAEAHKGRDTLITELAAEGFIPESVLYKRLGCYSKTELLGALHQTGLATENSKTSTYIESYGLCSTSYLTQALVQLGHALNGQRLSPDEVASKLQESGLKLDSDRIEALIARLPGFRVNRQSLFEVFVEKV